MKRILVISLILVCVGTVIAQQTMKLGGGEISISRVGALVLRARSDKTIALQSPTTIAGATTITGATTLTGDAGLTGTLTQNGILKQTTTVSLTAAQIIAGAATAFANVRGVEASITPVANAAIVITNATAAFAAGTGTAVITIDYHVAI